MLKFCTCFLLNNIYESLFGTFLFCLDLDYYSLEIDYYSNKTNKHICNNFQLIASTKKNLKTAEEEIKQGGSCFDNFSYLSLGLEITKSAKSIFEVQAIFFWERCKSLYIYINTIYVNKNHHCRSRRNVGPQGSPLLSTLIRALYCQLSKKY